MTTQPPSYEKKSLYEFGDILFSGSYATVKSAKIIATQKQVTAKIIFKKNFNGDIFEKEVGVLRELNHPNIVNFVDWFESIDEHFIIVESASGQSLSEVLVSQGSLPEKKVKPILKTMLSALEYIHSMNVVHRDLKLANVIYKDRSLDSKLMIIGFGASIALKSSDQLLTEKCGTLVYTAPEVSLGQGYGKPIDLWSIGIITFALLNGDTPSQSRIEEIQSMSSIKTFGGDRNSIITLEELIEFLLNQNPDKRPTATEALIEFIHH